MIELVKPPLELKNAALIKQQPNKLGSVSTKDKGDQAEQRACVFLKQAGYRILQTNVRLLRGELDIIAQKGESLVFVEVKYRSKRGSGSAVDQLTWRKKMQLQKLAAAYCSRFGVNDSYQIDLIAIDGTTLQHYQNITW